MKKKYLKGSGLNGSRQALEQADISSYPEFIICWLYDFEQLIFIF